MRLRTTTTGVPEALVVIDQAPRRALDRFEAMAEDAATMAAGDIREAVSGGVIGPGQGILRRAVDHGVRRKEAAVIAWAGAKPRAAFLFRYHDQGFRGEVKVRAHKRMGWKAFGRKYWPEDHWVFAHVRQVDYPGHHFMDAAADRAGRWLFQQLTEVAT